MSCYICMKHDDQRRFAHILCRLSWTHGEVETDRAKCYICDKNDDDGYRMVRVVGFGDRRFAHVLCRVFQVCWHRYPPVYRALRLPEWNRCLRCRIRWMLPTWSFVRMTEDGPEFYTAFGLIRQPDPLWDNGGDAT